MTIREKLGKGFWYSVALFLLFVFFRLVYGYLYPGKATDSGITFFSNLQIRKNYASYEKSSRYESDVLKEVNPDPKVQSSDEKYEKTAWLSLRTSQFEQDEKRIRTEIKQKDAVIQNENREGLTGKRLLQLAIGVPPAAFDTMVSILGSVGKLQSIEIKKEDRTNEFRKLNAKRATLEKTRTSLYELKSKGGRIEELIALENRILEIEGEIQQLGVSLGEFTSQKEYCTILLTLTERADTHISFLQRIKVALEWAVKYYGFLLIGLFCGSLTFLICLEILRRFEWLPDVLNR
ncbi:MAG: DUF4349 domain-containing protein [Bacteroidia bacterium]|nr:DUF4349 domain-containing protein [Bacteroidia bacterium]